ncbi:MAG: NUDIX hydrolase [Lachnospiraceae bacterium]|nr:NUDIX hydrolase [Lachnospiraceae bacterium]MDE6626960.1 NUDIX hydrolase [Lachnospiraceae bacterium]
MRFVRIEKREPGKFINRYDITYETVDHKEKVYEMISRSRELKTREDLADHPADSVVLIMHDETGDRLLLNREYRMACGDFVFNFPAGLIDPGEEFKESARRELKEETGLDLIRIDDVLGESFSAIGFSNEKNICVVGVAKGDFAPSSSTVEEIEAGWYTRAEVRELLKKEYFAARTQSYCYLWSKEG